MRETIHVVSEEEIKGIKSMKDDSAIALAEETPDGINPYYHTIGTMGGIAVRDKYASISSIKNSDKETFTK